MSRTGLNYRADIDGLRAVAVISVVMFHAKVPGFAGGFVGVDVFFVISGYLIGGLIWKEISEGRFTVRDFYVRRIRRIFPALFTTLGVCIVTATLVLAPWDLQSFAASARAAALFFANVFFFRNSAYFDAPAASQPLLHTWSLAVEEQFYIVFPLLLLWCRTRRPLTVVGILAALSLVSFCASEIWLGLDASAAFYLAPFRAWEFLVGSIVSIGGLAGVRLSGPLANPRTLSFAGLGLVGISVIALDEGASFPGAAALLPCLGTALLLHAGAAQRPDVVTRALACAPMSFLGRLSYSWYLWHWPVLVFWKYRVLRELGPSETFAAIAGSLVLAGLSWRFVEQPFRRQGSRRATRAPFVAAAVLMGLLPLFAWTVDRAEGWPGRFAGSAALQAQRLDHISKACTDRGEAAIEAGRLCSLLGGATPQDPKLLVWGDSHAYAIAPGLRIGEPPIEGVMASQNGCPPLLDTWPAGSAKGCRERNAAAADLGARLGAVVLVARWPFYLERHPSSGEGPRRLMDAQSAPLTRASRDRGDPAAFARGLERTLAFLAKAHARVVVVATVPEFGQGVPEMLFRQAQSGAGELDVIISRAQHDRRNLQSSRMLRDLASRYGAAFVDPADALCDAVTCRGAEQGQPLYFDDNHLDRAGALRVGKLVAAALSTPVQGAQLP